MIANALILKHVLTDEKIPQHVANAMLSAGFGPVMFLIVVNIILLIGGQFMEPSGLLVIVAPLVFPIAIDLGRAPYSQRAGAHIDGNGRDGRFACGQIALVCILIGFALEFK